MSLFNGLVEGKIGTGKPLFLMGKSMVSDFPTNPFHIKRL
jgi:hypothetical protein